MQAPEAMRQGCALQAPGQKPVELNLNALSFPQRRPGYFQLCRALCRSTRASSKALCTNAYRSGAYGKRHPLDTALGARVKAQRASGKQARMGIRLSTGQLLSCP
jgi:hypothetical protein